MDTFGERLANIRKAKGLSQKQLADLLGYKQPASISGIESDKNPVDINALVKIAEIFQVDLHWLITGEKSPEVVDLMKTLARIALKTIVDTMTQLEGVDKKIAELEEQKRKGLMPADSRKDFEGLKQQREGLRTLLNESLEAQPAIKEAIETMARK